MPIRPQRQQAKLKQATDEVHEHLEKGLIPFWRERAADTEDGGYLTRFNEAGVSLGTPEKYLNTQCRLLWWFATLAQHGPDRDLFAGLARHGFDFIARYFWDERHGGWFWKVLSDGTRLDAGKVVYGQSFAIYALSEYALATGDSRALELAANTFDLLQVHAADTLHGGYFENLEQDWTPSAPGFTAGDRKSLDTHMHLMESYTTLLAASRREVCRRKLIEVIELIKLRMIDPATGCGRNQFALDLTPIPAIAIRRTWNAEREGTRPAVPIDTTSYGHNVELAWLMRRALETAGVDPAASQAALRRLLDHAFEHGVDWREGGVFRDGTAEGGPLVFEKEFWQNSETLVGFLDGYELFGDERYLDAFLNIWQFARAHFIAPCGEWRILLDRSGRPIDANVGNDWKTSYHTGRAMLECLGRLRRLTGEME